MRRDKRGHVSIPTAKQNRGTSIIALRQTEPAIFLRHFDSKCAEFGKSLEIFRWNFTGAIDLVPIDMLPQIIFQLAQKIFASRAIFRALRGIRVNPIKIIASDEKIAGKTAAILERIARGLGQLECFALAFRHLRCVDDGGYRFFRLVTGRVRPTGGCRAGFFSYLLFRRFERRFHVNLSFRAGVEDLPQRNIKDVSTSLDMTTMEVRARDFSLHKISLRLARAFSKYRRAKISLRFAPVGPLPRQSSLVQNVRRNATVRRGTARNQFLKSFRNRRPQGNRQLSLPHSPRLRSPSERSAGGSAPLRLTANADRDASPVRQRPDSGRRRLLARHATHAATASTSR